MTLRRTSAWSAALLAPVAAVVVATGVSAAEPSPAPGEPFGQHVRACAQAMGFDGSHNPGMHRGASPWHADHHADHHADGTDHHC
jgi:hypothetical protein